MMTSNSPKMDFDKVSASDGEESKIYSNYNRLSGNKLRFQDFDETKLSEEDDAHIDSFTSSSSVACEICAELLSETNSNEFDGGYFSSSLLEKGSVWISGRDRMRNSVLWHVLVPDFRVLLRTTIKGLNVYMSTIMVSFANIILFANKGDNGIYGFNTQNQSFETIFHDESYQVDAMCCNDDYLYIFQKKHPDVIQILDSKFQSVGFMPTGFKGKISKCKGDLCTTTTKMDTSMQDHFSAELKMKHQHMCVISTSNQYKSRKMVGARPSVSAVNEAGVIWQVDSKKCPELDKKFNPCSVSCSATGHVIIADKGSKKVSKLVDIGHLHGQNGIFHIIDQTVYNVSEVFCFISPN